MASSTSTKFLTVEEVANVCRVHRRTVTRLIDCGRLRSVRMGRRRLIDAADLEQFLASTCEPVAQREPDAS
jgi:excisionase family DNA binding protein